MKTFLNLAAALVTIGLITGCGQDTVDSKMIAPANGPTVSSATNNIDRDYDLIGQENSNEVSFLATFRMAGTWSTTIRLSSPAQLVFDGRKVEDSQLLSKEQAVVAGTFLPIFSPFLFLASGTHYQARATAFRTHEIQWTDQTGHIYIDHMSVVPCYFQETPRVVAKSLLSTWNVKSEGGGNVSYSASLEQEKGDHTLVSAGTSSTNGRLRFSNVDIKQFEAGPATLKIECATKVALDSHGSGRATGSSRYELQTSVMVIP